MCVCVSLRWAVDCGVIRSSPRPKHGEHRRGAAQHSRRLGWIWFPQVRHHKESTSARSRLLGPLMQRLVLVSLPGTPRRCHRSSSGSATWPSRSTAASCSSSQSLKDWTSPAVCCFFLIKWRCPTLCAQGERCCVYSCCNSKNVQTSPSFMTSDVVK